MDQHEGKKYFLKQSKHIIYVGLRIFLVHITSFFGTVQTSGQDGSNKCKFIY